MLSAAKDLLFQAEKRTSFGVASGIHLGAISWRVEAYEPGELAAHD
jgi:hypothetical protein